VKGYLLGAWGQLVDKVDSSDPAKRPVLCRSERMPSGVCKTFLRAVVPCVRRSFSRCQVPGADGGGGGDPPAVARRAGGRRATLRQGAVPWGAGLG
jgi:hypothetical protein